MGPPFIPGAACAREGHAASPSENAPPGAWVGVSARRTARVRPGRKSLLLRSASVVVTATLLPRDPSSGSGSRWPAPCSSAKGPSKLCLRMRTSPESSGHSNRQRSPSRASLCGPVCAATPHGDSRSPGGRQITRESLPALELDSGTEQTSDARAFALAQTRGTAARPLRAAIGMERRVYKAGCSPQALVHPLAHKGTGKVRMEGPPSQNDL